MSTDAYQPIQGMSDLGPPEIHLWQTVEAQARRVLALYGFEEVRTPILERTELFTRSIGDTTDVVQKEMYTFRDRGGRSLTLRPEGTAGVMRYVAGQGPEALEARIYYLGPMFRSERPQAGRKRQFHQVGGEALGPANPAVDAEIIALQLHLLAEWGLEKAKVQINTRGSAGELATVQEGLREAIRPHLDRLGEDDRRRFDENVLRILDSKDPACQAVLQALPPLTDFMGAESRDYLDRVSGYLDTLDIVFEVNPRLVRGLDYYVHTVWEIMHPSLGAQDVVSGGGRYQIDVGGKRIEGVGFAMGLERIMMALQAETSGGERTVPVPLVWVVSQGEEAFRENLVLSQALRMRGVCCCMDMTGRSVKAQMRAANRAGATAAIIRGEQEMEKGTFMFKNMEDGTQEELSMPELMERLTPVRVHSVS